MTHKHIEATVEEAITREVRLLLTYQKPDEAEPDTRHVSPYEVRTFADGSKGIIGYDHRRDQYRTFKVSRVNEVEIVEVPAHNIEEES